MRTFRPAVPRVVAVAISCAAILAALTGCAAWKAASAASASAAPTVTGGPLAGLTGSEILTRAVTDLEAAPSVRVAGTTKVPGQTTVVDLMVGAHGCTGSIEFLGQGSVAVLGSGGTVWMKPEQQFYQATGVSAAEQRKLAGKYLRTSVSQSGIGSLCFLGQLAAQISGTAGRAVLGKATTILGQPALRLNDAKQPGDAYVTASARPEFLRVGTAAGYVDFTDYGVAFTVTPPPAAQTVDGASYNF